MDSFQRGDEESKSLPGLSSSKPSTLALQQIVDRLDHPQNEGQGEQLLQDCKLVKALSLAGRTSSLAESEVPQKLLQLLLSADSPASQRVAVADALYSLAVRDPCVGDALLKSTGEPVLLTLLNTAAVKGQVSIALGLLRLVVAMAGHKAVMRSLFKEGLCGALASLCYLPESTVKQKDAHPAMAEDEKKMEEKHKAQIEDRALLQRSVLQYLQTLSSHVMLHPLLLAGAVPEALTKLLKSCQKAITLELGVAVVNNLSCGGRACQEAMLQAGVVEPVVKLLWFKNSQVLFNALDALSNLMIGYPAAQIEVGAAANSGVIPLVSSMLGSKSKILISKACRCISNLVLNNADNQGALLASPNVMSNLVKLSGSRVPQIVRLALGTLANAVARNEAAQTAAFKAGALPVAVQLLHSAIGEESRRSKEQIHNDRNMNTMTEHSSSVNSLSGGMIKAPELSTESKRQEAYDIAERVCLLLANLIYHSQDSKIRLVEAGALPPLVLLLSSSRPAVVAGAAAALSNLAARDILLQRRLVDEGTMESLSRLLPDPPSLLPAEAQVSGAEASLPAAMSIEKMVEGSSSAEVISKTCHALGSLVFNNPTNQEACFSSGVAHKIVFLVRHARSYPSVAAEAARALGNLAFNNPDLKLQLGDTGAVQALVDMTKLNTVAPIKAALVALVNLTDRCSANRTMAIESGVSPLLGKLLRVRGDEIVARAAFCAHVLAGGSISGKRGDITVSVEAQEALGEAGLIPSLVRLLDHSNPDLLGKVLLAFGSLVQGSRSNKVRTAAAGGIARLAALLDGSQVTNAQLSHHIIDAWVALGGLMALVKLLDNKHPFVAEMAARRIAELASGGSAGPAAGPASILSREELLHAGAAPALVRACQNRNQRVAQAALKAVAELAMDSDGRNQLVDAGAMRALEDLKMHRTPALSKLATSASQHLFVKSG